jgi:hypothetical protein
MQVFVLCWTRGVSPLLHKALQHHLAACLVEIDGEFVAIHGRDCTGAELDVEDAGFGLVVRSQTLIADWVGSRVLDSSPRQPWQDANEALSILKRNNGGDLAPT